MAFVYFLKDPNIGFKIGYTKDEPKKRLKALQTGNPILRIYKTMEFEEKEAKYIEGWLQKCHMASKITGSSGTEFVKINEEELECSITEAIVFSKQYFKSESDIDDTINISSTSGELLSPTDEDLKILGEINALTGEIYLLGEKKKLLINRLKKRIMGSEGIGEVATWSFSSKTSLDIERIKQEAPKVFKKYSRVTNVRTFRTK